jgi:uncharacterized membrane protein YtjA (UPF0391 family)
MDMFVLVFDINGVVVVFALHSLIEEVLCFLDSGLQATACAFQRIMMMHFVMMLVSHVMITS